MIVPLSKGLTFQSAPTKAIPASNDSQLLNWANMETPDLSQHPLRVLMVDDDIKLAELVSEYLKREGMEIHLVHNGETGLARAQSGEYAIVVLDVMLPGLGGFEVLRRLRETSGKTARLPVLMLSARGDEVDRVVGLELGADDYLAKPFSSRELVARLRAILRRAQGQNSEEKTPRTDAKIVRVGDIELNAASREVRRDAERLDLTSGEFDLLEVLLRSAGEAVTREKISKAALGRALMPYDRSIDVHISNLRRKLGPTAQGGERIKAVRGVGYIYAHSDDT
jgi:two-component system, OmpR family, response regulator CpxR